MPRVSEKCSVEICKTVQYAKGICRRHYLALKRTGLLILSDSGTMTLELPPCSLEGCGNPMFSRKMCIRHYTRWQRYGDPDQFSLIFSKSTEERFWEKVVKSDNCWLWDAYLTEDGYGGFSFNGVTQGAHRYSYMLHHELDSLPDHKYVDHRCHTPSCVRPDHLRLATPKQNNENKKTTSTKAKSGIRGVSMHPCGKWQGHVGHKGKTYHVGLFVDIKDAEAAVVAKRNELHTFNDHDRGTAPVNVATPDHDSEAA